MIFYFFTFKSALIEFWLNIFFQISRTDSVLKSRSRNVPTQLLFFYRVFQNHHSCQCKIFIIDCYPSKQCFWNTLYRFQWQLPSTAYLCATASASWATVSSLSATSRSPALSASTLGLCMMEPQQSCPQLNMQEMIMVDPDGCKAVFDWMPFKKCRCVWLFDNQG